MAYLNWQIKRINSIFLSIFISARSSPLYSGPIIKERALPNNMPTNTPSLQNTESDIMSKRAELFARLDRLGIAHKTLEHARVFTVEEGKEIKASLPGGHTKNLFLKDKAGRLFLICALGSTVIKINKLHKELGCKRLSFGSEELLLKHLGVTPGSVTIFSVMNDVEQAVTLVLDKALFDDPLVNFHPLLNNATATIASAQLIDFAQDCGHKPVIVDFDILMSEATGPT